MSISVTIGELLESQAKRASSSPFLHLPELCRTVSFGEAARLAGDVAAILRQHGAGAGDRVVVQLSNGLAAASTLLAIMGHGTVAVPLNPRLTRDELQQALELSAATILICEAGARDTTADHVGDAWQIVHESASSAIVLFARMERGPLRPPLHDRPSSVDDPALILFTSGTTGTPKGVVLTHRNLLTNAAFVRDAHHLNSGDTALCVLPFFHINGFEVTLLTPLLTGQAVVVPSRFDAARFWAWVQEYRVTWFSAVPTILSLLLSGEDVPESARATLRFARSASAPLPVSVLHAFESRFGVPVIETYGISEAACQVTANPLPPAQRKSGSAGRPVGTELRIVDDRGTSLPGGTIGEVIITGDNVFGGYLDNPVADREALRRGWFHTGDLGYLDDEGFLFLTGRRKELINRAGEKIAPREVEEVIHHLPEVENVGVVGVPHSLYGEEVAAFITLRAGRILTPERVTSHCKEHLIGFKVPKEVFFINELPKGPSGKIQRRRLLDVYARIKENR